MHSERIYSGKVEDVHRSHGSWVFVDVGFSREQRSCGFLVDDQEALLLQFSDLVSNVIVLTQQSHGPLNLVIEAPLSAAFTAAGNPAGRSFESRDKQHRYWYSGMGCQVTTSAAYLLRAAVSAGLRRNVLLYEAFVSFKSKDFQSSHTADVMAMRDVVWRAEREPGELLSEAQLLGKQASKLVSAFDVYGFDFGVPPVIVARVTGR